MHDVDKDKMKTVILMDILDISLPRIRSLQDQLTGGRVLADSELDFLHEALDKIIRCNRIFEQDLEVSTIFNRVSHLLSEVISMALDNEQKNSS